MKSKEKALDWDYLYDILDYNSDSGIFTTKIGRGGKPKGSVAGTERKDGYYQIQINGNIYLAHRLAWFYEYAYWPINLIDHKDTIRNHNWISNLRECTHSQNKYNTLKTFGSSKYRGVSYDTRDSIWIAEIHYDKKKVRLGRFLHEKDAATSYNSAALKYHGKFAKLNII